MARHRPQRGRARRERQPERGRRARRARRARCPSGPHAGVRVLLLSTGSEESFMEGMQGFMRRHRDDARPDAHDRAVPGVRGQPDADAGRGGGHAADAPLQRRRARERLARAAAEAGRRARARAADGRRHRRARRAASRLRAPSRSRRSTRPSSRPTTTGRATRRRTSTGSTIERAFAVADRFVRDGACQRPGHAAGLAFLVGGKTAPIRPSRDASGDRCRLR